VPRLDHVPLSEARVQQDAVSRLVRLRLAADDAVRFEALTLALCTVQAAVSSPPDQVAASPPLRSPEVQARLDPPSGLPSTPPQKTCQRSDLGTGARE
jgi:hypothetical protein